MCSYTYCDWVRSIYDRQSNPAINTHPNPSCAQTDVLSAIVAAMPSPPTPATIMGMTQLAEYFPLAHANAAWPTVSPEAVATTMAKRSVIGAAHVING